MKIGRVSFSFSHLPNRISSKSIIFSESGSNVYLLAGAPTALSEEPGLNRTGGVFYCPVTTNTNDCRRVDITMKGEML